DSVSGLALLSGVLMAAEKPAARASAVASRPRERVARRGPSARILEVGTEVAEEVVPEAPLGEAPGPVDLREAVEVIAADDRLEPERIGLLEDHHVRLRDCAVGAVGLDHEVRDDVARARRAVRVAQHRVAPLPRGGLRIGATAEPAPDPDVRVGEE